VFYQGLKDIRNKKGGAKVFVVPMIHQIHTKDGSKIETSGTNSNYAAILENMKVANAIVVATPRQRDDILKRYGLGNIHVIPHACTENSVVEKAPFASRKRTELVYLARYSKEKRHDLAVEAFSKVVKALPNATLSMYGKGSEKTAIISLIARLGLQKSVFVNDYTQDVSSVYRRAGISILTSTNEGYPLGIMESLSNGCPVIAFDVRYGPADMIEEGVSGWLVPFGDIDALANRIVSVLSNPALHGALCDGAFDASRQFQADRIAAAWKRLVAECSLQRLGT
jgi:glycosyltransferase involved in cell wall biosynthesis